MSGAAGAKSGPWRRPLPGPRAGRRALEERRQSPGGVASGGGRGGDSVSCQVTQSSEGRVLSQEGRLRAGHACACTQHVCTRVCTCQCAQVCMLIMRAHAYLHVCTSCVCVHEHTFMCVCMRVCTCACRCGCVCPRAHLCMFMPVCTCVPTVCCPCVCVYVSCAHMSVCEHVSAFCVPLCVYLYVSRAPMYTSTQVYT